MRCVCVVSVGECMCEVCVCGECGGVYVQGACVCVLSVGRVYVRCVCVVSVGGVYVRARVCVCVCV